jgi:hypothetical protein
LPQNFSPGSAGAPHAAQSPPRGAPHSVQKRRSERLSWPQGEQRIRSGLAVASTTIRTGTVRGARCVPVTLPWAARGTSPTKFALHYVLRTPILIRYAA